MFCYYNEMSLEQRFFAFQRQTLTLFLGSKLRPQIVFRAFCFNNYEKNSFTRFPIMCT